MIAKISPTHTVRSLRGQGKAGLPPAPDGARLLFGPSLPAIEEYGRLLAGPGVERGLLGPGEVGRLWERHLLNCGALADLVPARARVVDLGSGAGLPGIVLAVIRPDLTLTLLEPMLRRTAFLEECVARLGLSSVKVRRARAEDVAGDMRADVVVARAVAPLDRLSLWALPLLRPGGVLLALKGARAGEELSRASDSLARLGAADARVVRAGEGRVEPPVIVVSVVAGPARRRASRRRR